MAHSLRMFASIVLLIMVPTSAFAFTTSIDTTAQTVRVDFTGLSAYEQIRLEGVDALYWCACLDSDNPSSLSSTGFTVNAGNLEMQYEGAAPPSTNYIIYHYLDGYVFKGFESVDWVVVSGEDEMQLTGDRPILEPVPEPSSAWLSAIALGVVGVLGTIRSGDRGGLVSIGPILESTSSVEEAEQHAARRQRQPAQRLRHIEDEGPG